MSKCSALSLKGFNGKATFHLYIYDQVLSCKGFNANKTTLQLHLYEHVTALLKERDSWKERAKNAEWRLKELEK
jgi:hypothetical protein